MSGYTAGFFVKKKFIADLRYSNIVIIVPYFLSWEK